MSNAVEIEVRALVRELLREIVPTAPLAPRDAARPVTIANSADLKAFAALVLDLAKDSAVEHRIRAGRIPFELVGNRPTSVAEATTASPFTAPSAPAVTPVLRIDKGAVTEKVVNQAAAHGTRLVLGPRAVITPLAKEAARKHGVGIERSS